MSFISFYLRVNKVSNEDSLTSTSTQKRNRSYDTTDLVTYIRPPCTGEIEKTGRNLLRYCKYCENPVYCSQITIRFRNHLQSKYKLDLQTTRSNSGSVPYDETLQKILDKEFISKTFISMIVEYNLPFRFVKKDIFY